eukprot:g5979.t1
MAESTKISSITRGIPKFDGNPIKYEDWKTTTLAVLEISRNDLFEILTGESTRPDEHYMGALRQDTQEASGSGGPPTDEGSQHAAASGQESKTNESAGAQQQRSASTPAARRRVADSLAARIDTSPADSTSRPSRSLFSTPLNASEIKVWEKNNAALYSVLYLVTSGAARCLLRKFETKKDQKADGRGAWLALKNKYENMSSHRRQALMARLANSRMEEGSDPDIFFSKIDQLCDELEVMDESVSKHRKMDIIMSGMPAEYDLIRFQAMKDPEFSLEELQLTMRNMHMNGFTKSTRNGRGTAMTAGLIKHDRSKVKCHSCGMLGHYKNECTSAGAGRQPSSNKNSNSKFKPRHRDDQGGKKKWCSFHNSGTHDDSECYTQKKAAQKDGKSIPRASRGKQQVDKTRDKNKNFASTAEEEQDSDSDTVSKGEIARVFKHISMSLLAHEKDSTTSDQDEEEDPKAMGFSFTAVDTAEQALFTAGDSNNFSMMVDSGASDHYVDDKLVPGIKNKMINLRQINPAREITTAGNHTLHGTATGDIVCEVTDSNGNERLAHIPIVIVPGIGKHLFSSGSAKARGIKTVIGDSPRLEKDNMHFPLREDGRLFKIDLRIQPRKVYSQEQLALATSSDNTEKWHRRLGHLNEASMKTLRSKPGSGVKFQDALQPCKTCKLGKSAQQNHPKTSTVTTTLPFELVYTDLAGPFKPQAKDGSRYISKFSDHHTRWKAAYPIASKDKALDTLIYFIQDYVITTGNRIQRLRCDKGGEYMADYYRNYCKETGIQMEFAATNTPQQNGVSERDGRTILNMVRCILIDTGLPKFLWGEICETAVFLINRAPHRAIDGSSPYAKLFGKEPDLSGLRAIGARAFVHKERYGNKLEEKAWEGVMLGYGKDSKSYRIYNPHNRRITESRNVTFIETPHRSLKNADQDELYSNNGEEDEIDEDYRQDVLAHLPLLDAETDSTVKKKDEDKHEPRPPYYEGSPSPAPSIESGGEVESPASPNSGGSPHDGFSQPDDNDSGGQEESYEQDDSGQASSDVGAPLDPVQEEDEEGDTSAGQQDQQGSSPAQQASTPVDLSRQPVTSLNRTLRSMGPTHDTPSIENIDTAGLDGKSKSMLRRVQIDMKGYDEPEQKDQAHLVYAPSFVEYAYVTETSAQSNPDPASISLPNTFKEAKASSHSAQWTAAMNKELTSLKENNVYDLIPRKRVPAGCKVIGSRWVFKVKSNYTFKARLVCQRYAQRPGIDCGATFAPVCRIESQRILMAIACHYDWDIIMLDVKTAFLQSPIDAPTYVRQPPGYEKMDAQGKPLVMKLKQAVYGLRTASRVWHLTLDKALQDLGFRATKTDPCMYTLQIGGEYCILTIYVDDILVTAPDKKFLARIKKKLMERFTMSDLGEVSLILGMKITRDRVKKTLSINQTDYTLSILERFGMQDCNPVSTPCQGGEIPLEQPAGTLLDEDGIKTYQSLVGSLLYLSRVSRWDIAFATLELCRAASKPSKAHLTKAKHVLRYLKGRPQLDIVYTSGKFELLAWADASFAQDLVKRRSTSGYLFLLSGAPISWCAVMQSLTALSTTEAEMVAISYAAREACHIQDTLHELGLGKHFRRIKIENDSTGALSLVTNNSFSARTKHLQIRKWFISQLIASGRLDVGHCSSTRLPADLFTKACSRIIHRKLVDLIIGFSNN